MFAELDTFGIIIFTFFCFLVITHSRGRWRRVAYNVNWFYTSNNANWRGLDAPTYNPTGNIHKCGRGKSFAVCERTHQLGISNADSLCSRFFSLVGHTFADLFPWREIQLIKSQILPVMWRKNSRLFMQLTVLFFFSSACRNLIV